MSGRKNVLPPFKLFDSVDISADRTSSQSDIAHQDNLGIIISWTGSSPVGELFVQCSNQKETETPTWINLDFGSSIAVTGNSGSHNININQNPFTRVRLYYVRASGTGNLTAVLSGKMV